MVKKLQTTIKVHLAGGLVWFIFAALTPLHAKVFTTRTGKVDLDVPETVGAKSIYGGQFRINGRPAEMNVMASSLSVIATMRLLKESLPEKQLQFRVSADTAVGRIVNGSAEKRFLVASMGDPNGCLIFLLRGDADAFVRTRPDIPWPASLPVLDPLQSPQLVVEHQDNRFTFACVSIPSSQPQSVLQGCRERLQADGWDAIPSGEAAVTRMLESGFAVLGGKTKICWLEARAGSNPGQTIVTLVCRVL